jgi:hypothetical protein
VRCSQLAPLSHALGREARRPSPKGRSGPLGPPLPPDAHAPAGPGPIEEGWVDRARRYDGRPGGRASNGARCVARSARERRADFTRRDRPDTRTRTGKILVRTGNFGHSGAGSSGGSHCGRS